MASFRAVLVAADLSERSAVAFRVACEIADSIETHLYVLHVVERSAVVEQPVGFDEEGAPSPLPASGTCHRDELADRLRERYVPARPIALDFIVREGIASEEILRAAGEVGADLIVLGTHGRTGLRRLLTGSVTEFVLRHATCPILALHTPEDVRPEAGAIRVILHPTDLSDKSDAALKVARELARDHGARLLLLHVEPIQVVEGVVLGAPIDPRGYHEPLMKLRAEAGGQDLKHPVEMRCVQGDPATEILRAAEEIGCDLIVLGTHGRSALGRLLMGSVAEDVLRQALCPVLIVKRPRPDRADSPGDARVKSVNVY